MAATTGFRTFYPALIPPGARHVDGVFSAGPVNSEDDLLSAVSAASIIGDFLVRSAGLADLRRPSFANLPLISKHPLSSQAIKQFLRLNCLTHAYADIWERITDEKWTPEVPVRTSLDRLKAQTFIDVAIAYSLGITAEELCMIYRTQFPVMRKYDSKNKFDLHGRSVPDEILKNLETTEAEERSLTWAHPQSGKNYTFMTPFNTFDREVEIRNVFGKLTSS